MLTVENLSIKLGNEPILNTSSLTIQKNQIYGLIAINGAGKTTLLRTIAGLYPIQQGKVLLKDDKTDSAFTLMEKKKNLFYFETSEWFDGNLSGKDYLTFVAKQWNGTKEMIEEAIDFWKLRDFYKKPIKKYSLGMRQKTLLALYYVSNTSYWLMDEPTIGIDVESQEVFTEFMKQAKERGIAILFTSHQNDSMLSIADSFYVLENRKLTLQKKATMVKGEG